MPWQFDGEDGSASGRVASGPIQNDPPTLRLGQFSRDREPEPGAVRMTSDERLEHMLTQFRRHARPGILDTEPQQSVRFLGAKRHTPTGGRVPQRVQDKVVERADE